MNKSNGGQAFPVPYAHNEGDRGMTLRDYFAAKAMEGAIAGAMADGSRLGKESPREFALTAYIIADAMLVARENAANPVPMPKHGTIG